MKKILFFLILGTIIIYLTNTKVNAETYKFYEAEFISDIYMTKKDASTGTYYYQKARFFRQVGTNDFAYCLEAFRFFNGDGTYNQTTPPNLTSSQLDRITKIAHYGYGYPGHSDKTWYAVTQVMIWRTVVNDNDVYFTDKINGNKINSYDGMINELNNLIKEKETIPSFSNKTINLVEDEEIELQDTNKVLNNYKTSNFTIKDNKLIIKNAKEGTYNISLTRNDNYYNKPVLFYISNDSQNLVQTGNITTKNVSLKVIVKSTNIKIIKLDKDTNSIKPSGEGNLLGSIFGIYDTNNNLINKIKIEDNNEGLIKNIKYGKYYIKELIAGTGYKINNEKIDFELNENTTNIKLRLINEIIKKKIIINKTYGNKNHQKPEANIEFNIYDSNNKLINTIKTNELGKAEIILPYGTYTIKQLSTTEGYAFNSPIKIKVLDEKEQVLNLKDYQIEVPNTSIKISLLERILNLLL